VLGIFAEDIAWHVPDAAPCPATTGGTRRSWVSSPRPMELSGGTLRVEADEILADGERIIALTTVSAERNGQSWSSPEVHVWRVQDGRAVAFREFQGDQEAEDRFWSS
jgi:uncharacterized protein